LDAKGPQSEIVTKNGVGSVAYLSNFFGRATFTFGDEDKITTVEHLYQYKQALYLVDFMSKKCPESEVYEKYKNLAIDIKKIDLDQSDNDVSKQAKSEILDCTNALKTFSPVLYNEFKESWMKNKSLKVMIDAIAKKLSKNPTIVATLKDVKNGIFVENVTKRSYATDNDPWGNGKRGEGYNRLGVLFTVIARYLNQHKDILNEAVQADILEKVNGVLELEKDRQWASPEYLCKVHEYLEKNISSSFNL
jgi:hypothetical protein